MGVFAGRADGANRTALPTPKKLTPHPFSQTEHGACATRRAA